MRLLLLTACSPRARSRRRLSPPAAMPRGSTECGAARSPRGAGPASQPPASSRGKKPGRARGPGGTGLPGESQLPPPTGRAPEQDSRERTRNSPAPPATSQAREAPTRGEPPQPHKRDRRDPVGVARAAAASARGCLMHPKCDTGFPPEAEHGALVHTEHAGRLLKLTSADGLAAVAVKQSEVRVGVAETGQVAEIHQLRSLGAVCVR